MKTFESQLLELLREYEEFIYKLNIDIDLKNKKLVESLGGDEVIGVDKDEYRKYIKGRIERVDLDLENFCLWLSKRVEQEPSEIPFENTPLDSRIRNVLDNVNVTTLDDLRRLSVVKLRNIQGLGEKGVKRCLELMTISL
jgi:hypothetical protein